VITKKIARVRIQWLLRNLGLLSSVEGLRYYLKLAQYRKSNRQFIQNNPGFSLPPTDLAFDAYSAPAWDYYKRSGEGTASFLKEVANKYLPQFSSLSIYEWGCGPARVIRHLSTLFNKASIAGSDYNTATIEWCSQNISRVNFVVNGLNPPLTYEDQKFDMVYCISVFTHLSEETGKNWMKELIRILKPNGVLVFSTLGNSSYQTELLPSEKQTYDGHGVVVRGQYKEGRKMYLAVHNPSFVKNTLLNELNLLEHLPNGFPFIQQDCWIAQKK
jgi:SAM-dependent methyltransferase